MIAHEPTWLRLLSGDRGELREDFLRSQLGDAFDVFLDGGMLVHSRSAAEGLCTVCDHAPHAAPITHWSEDGDRFWMDCPHEGTVEAPAAMARLYAIEIAGVLSTLAKCFDLDGSEVFALIPETFWRIGRIQIANQFVTLYFARGLHEPAALDAVAGKNAEGGGDGLGIVLTPSPIARHARRLRYGWLVPLAHVVTLNEAGFRTKLEPFERLVSASKTPSLGVGRPAKDPERSRELFLERRELGELLGSRTHEAREIRRLRQAEEGHDAPSESAIRNHIKKLYTEHRSSSAS